MRVHQSCRRKDGLRVSSQTTSGRTKHDAKGNGERTMAMITYIKEFLYVCSGITALFACAAAAVLLVLAPFGLAIYISDVLGYHQALGMLAAIITFCFYWVAARHLNWIEGIK